MSATVKHAAGPVRLVDDAVGDLDLRADVGTACVGRTTPSASAPATVIGLEGRARLVGHADGAVEARPGGRLARRAFASTSRPVRHREDVAVVGVHRDRGRALGLVGPARRRRARSRCAPGATRRASGAGRDPACSSPHLLERDRVAARVLHDALLAVGAAELVVRAAARCPSRPLLSIADRADHLRGERRPPGSTRRESSMHADARDASAAGSARPCAGRPCAPGRRTRCLRSASFAASSSRVLAEQRRELARRCRPGP